ncbi:borealin-like isoform X2 [Hetaerina americana]|uniref:borealin-like isoform X2 n=1 Tax=Hetaerina americana TaxID=62018 RepID=UPI003A7F4781
MPRISRSTTNRTTGIFEVHSIRNEVKLLMRNRQRRHKDLLNYINNYYDKLLIDIPEDILNKPATKLTNEDMEIVKNGGLETLTKGNETAPEASSAKGATQKRLAPPRVKMSKLQTPALQTLPPNLMNTVTPKFNLNAPMSVVRVPREGEVAMSLTGSPLRVTSVITDSKPNVIVPLDNGRVLSVLPERGLRRSQMPELNDSLLYQLRVLKDNLNTLLENPPKFKP